MNNYYPFGLPEAGRSWSYEGDMVYLSKYNDYTYGYNGMQRDNAKGLGSGYTTLFREYDPEIARWKSLDPKLKDFPSESPFSAMGNNPIMNTDVLGDYVWVVTEETAPKYVLNAYHSYGHKLLNNYNTKDLEEDLNSAYSVWNNPKSKEYCPSFAKAFARLIIPVGVSNNSSFITSYGGKAGGEYCLGGGIAFPEDFLKASISQKRGIAFHEIGHFLYRWTEPEAYAAQAAMGYQSKRFIVDFINANTNTFEDIWKSSQFKEYFHGPGHDIIKSKEDEFFKKYKEYGKQVIEKSGENLNIEFEERLQKKALEKENETKN